MSPFRGVLLLIGGLLVALFPASAAPIDVALPMVAIESALADPTGKYIALGGTDGSVALLNAGDGTVVNQWPANGANQVTRLSFSADGTELLTVSPNRVIRILDTQGPQAERVRWNPTEYFPGADLTPDGKHALVVTHDGPIRWYDVATKLPVTEWRDVAQPHGYAYARLLTDDGLAVVAPITGDGALIDATSGRVLARLPLRGPATAQMTFSPKDITLRLEGGVATWKREALLAAAKAANPTATVEGWMLPVGGPVGHAALVSAPGPNWIFWSKNASLSGFAWAEPSWDAHPFLGISRPVVLDWPRRRMWFMSSKGHLQGWSWDELGQPDALAINPYLKPPTQVGASLAALEGAGGFQLLVDWREMAPVHAGSDSRSIPKAGMEKAFQVEVVSGTSVVGNWQWDLDPLGGWKIAWRSANQSATAATLLGFRNTRPLVSVSSQGTTAVYSSSPGMIVLGPNSAPPTPLGVSGVNVTVPAIRLFEPGAPRALGAFEDHRAVGVLDVRWASNSRWIATRDYDGSGNDANALRVYTAPGGKRVGSVHHSANRYGDFAVADDGSLVWSDGDGTVQVCRPGSQPEVILGPAAWSRSARVAFSPAGDLVALLTGTDEVVVLQVATHQELRRFKLPGGRGVGWEEPQGGVLFVSPTTILVAHGHSATLRKISL